MKREFKNNYLRTDVAIKNIWFIAAFTIIASLFFYSILLKADPIYLSTSTLFVNQKTPTQILDQSVVSVSQNLSETFSKLITTGPILEKASVELGGVEINKDDVLVSVVPRTQLIKVGVKNKSPQEAALIAGKIVEVFKAKVDELQRSVDKKSRVIIEVAEPASPPERPIFPNMPLLMSVGVVSFMFLALLLSYISELLDSTVSSQKKLQELFPKIPIIGTVPFSGDVEDPAFIESLRELRTNIFFLNPDHPPKIIAVTSPNQREGKTFLIMELAKMLAKADKKVLVVDADFRGMDLSRRVKLQGKEGLAEAIISGKPAVRGCKLGELEVLPAGNGPKNIIEIMASQKAENFFAKLHVNKQFDMVLVDTPAVNVVADASSLAKYSDGVLAVVETNRTTKKQLFEFVSSLKTLKVKIFGFILNKVKKNKRSYYYSKK